MEIMLISMDEGEFQPLGIAGPAAYLRKNGFSVRAFDLRKNSTFEFDIYADIVAFSVPIFGAIESSVEKAKEIRKAGFQGPFVFYNQYATVQPETFLLDDNCFVIFGEFEEELVQICKLMQQSKPIAQAEHVWSMGKKRPAKALKRATFIAPDRSDLPSLSTYARFDGAIVGNVETMRGCAHPCTYCSVFGAYERHVVKIPEEIVLEDIAYTVNAGATHITFVDADFFSTGKRGLAIVESMVERYPGISFDITARLDDIIRYKTIVERFKEVGCKEVTSAFEFPDENVLEIMNKGIVLDQMVQAVRLLQGIGIRLKPTFITYTPWIDSVNMGKLDAFAKEIGIADFIDPLQKQTRLLLYKGSPLLATDHIKPIRLMDRGVYYDWVHPDPRVDDDYNALEFEDSAARKRCCIKG